jgi:serine/threonine protein kinase
VDALPCRYKYIIKNQKLKWKYRHRYARDIAMGMRYLHVGCNMAHRDLKSPNVLIKDGRAKGDSSTCCCLGSVDGRVLSVSF